MIVVLLAMSVTAYRRRPKATVRPQREELRKENYRQTLHEFGINAHVPTPRVDQSRDARPYLPYGHLRKPFDDTALTQSRRPTINQTNMLTGLSADNYRRVGEKTERVNKTLDHHLVDGPKRAPEMDTGFVRERPAPPINIADSRQKNSYMPARAPEPQYRIQPSDPRQGSTCKGRQATDWRDHPGLANSGPNVALQTAGVVRGEPYII